MKLNFPENIKQLRKEKGITQESLAEQLGVSAQSISRWELSICYPDLEMLPSIANFFGVTVDYLLTLDHVTSLPEAVLPEKLSKQNHRFITAMSIVMVWLLATFLFVLIELLPYPATGHWLAFIYSVPISTVVWLVFNSIWFKSRRNFFIISVLMWTTLAAIHISVLPFHYNVWLVFVTGIPGQIIILLWSQLHRIKRPKKNKLPKE